MSLAVRMMLSNAIWSCCGYQSEKCSASTDAATRLASAMAQAARIAWYNCWRFIA